jgi:adenylate cyclase
MGIEIERKFIVKNNDWLKENVVKVLDMSQGYVSTNPAVRVRTSRNPAIRNSMTDTAKLTIKSSESGASRSEFEYDIPLEDADGLMLMAGSAVVHKYRHVIEVDGFLWEIDQFTGDNSGLIVAEVELESEDQPINTNLSWLGEEVTDDIRYYNAYLAKIPFKEWDE